VLGISIGLIASVVRYRHPLRSTFAVALAALFVGIVLFHSLPVSPAFADAEGIVHAVMLVLFLWFAYIFLLPIGFASCAVGGCVAGHVIQERSKRWFASPTLPACIILTFAMTGSAAALACTLWPGL
jgi:cation transporter-like permease